MDRPEIVIRDIHRHGEDLTVPEAIARIGGGGPVTVTVTDPAPPGGDPRADPVHGFGITVTPAVGSTSRPGQPPQVTWDRASSQAPASASLFAEALHPGQPARRLHRAPSAARARSPAPCLTAAATSPPGSTPVTRSPGTCPARPPCPAPSTWLAVSASAWLPAAC